MCTPFCLPCVCMSGLVCLDVLLSGGSVCVYLCVCICMCLSARIYLSVFLPACLPFYTICPSSGPTNDGVELTDSPANLMHAGRHQYECGACHTIPIPYHSFTPSSVAAHTFPRNAAILAWLHGHPETDQYTQPTCYFNCLAILKLQYRYAMSYQ